jgi:hypothetical protein
MLCIKLTRALIGSEPLAPIFDFPPALLGYSPQLVIRVHATGSSAHSNAGRSDT